MTLPFGVVLLIILFFAWRMKGAQMPHVFLGLILGKAATAGSIVDTIATQGLDLVNTMVNAISNAVGQGNVV